MIITLSLTELTNGIVKLYSIRPRPLWVSTKLQRKGSVWEKVGTGRTLILDLSLTLEALVGYRIHPSRHHTLNQLPPYSPSSSSKGKTISRTPPGSTRVSWREPLRSSLGSQERTSPCTLFLMCVVLSPLIHFPIRLRISVDVYLPIQPLGIPSSHLLAPCSRDAFDHGSTTRSAGYLHPPM